MWRYHPFVTNSQLPVAEADITHRRHAIIETTFADLIDGPLAHVPSGLFAANCAWLACAVITHNLLRAAGTLAGGDHAVARGATLRRDWSTCRPASPPRPANPPCTYPSTGPANSSGNPVAQRHRLPDHQPRAPNQTTSPCPPQHPRPDPRNPKEKPVPASRSPMPTAPARGTPHRNPPITARNHRSTESG